MHSEGSVRSSGIKEGDQLLRYASGEARHSREIAEKLRLKLTGEERKHLIGRETNNAEAYQYYLKGRY